jgi:hypothetical protein
MAGTAELLQIELPAAKSANWKAARIKTRTTLAARGRQALSLNFSSGLEPRITKAAHQDGELSIFGISSCSPRVLLRLFGTAFLRYWRRQ